MNASPRASTFDDWSDRDGDGTPACLELDSEHDRRAFRRWFTFLAESQYAAPPGALRDEISDCAALLRYAYRESLKKHDSAWASEIGLNDMLPDGSIDKYQYPRTPFGASLFRLTPGPFETADVEASFAQFADADHLRRFNTHFISRDLRRAKPGDLLFYRQIEQNLPYHAMIYLGPSHFEPSDQWIVYHTGPLGNHPGEIRRPSAGELGRHPSPRWRPLPGNGNFLGVYRWNILRESD